ncbi:MAG: DUF2029 domain-containing protein [Planctomycetes bacterium]|nr:DUF2029 domain-containing protein [Planctomycetota bacterium]
MASFSAPLKVERLSPIWLIALLGAFFAIVFVQYIVKLRHSEHGMRSAFLRWKPQLEDLDRGVNIWEKHAYPNPPIMAILLKPFYCLPATVGASLWFACKALMALAAIGIVLSLLHSAGEQSFPLWGQAIAVLLTLRPIEGDLVHGNINLLILFLLTAMFWAICQRRDGLAGMLLGLSIACKLTPALFLAYFIWKRAWTVLASAVASVAIFGLIVPGVVFGWHANIEYLQGWHRHMVAPYAAGVVTSEHKNQSLPGLLHRTLSDAPSFSDFDGDEKIVLERHNLAPWDREVVQGIVVGCMAIFAILAMVFCRTPMEARPRLALLVEFSVVLLGMLLFCERTWKHHCVTLLLPFSVLAYSVSTPVFSRGVRWYLAGTLVLAAVLMAATTTGIFDQEINVNDRLGKLAQVYGAYVWVFLLLTASLFVVLRQNASNEPSTE